MKTNKLFFSLAIVICTTACSTSYRISTRINTDGTAYREIYALGDSAFMAGDTSKSPYLFSFDARKWTVTRFDSVLTYEIFGEKEKYNVKIGKHTLSAGDWADGLSPEAFKEQLVVPHESLKQEFKWFYTYHTFTCVYPEIQDKGPIPLSKYLTPEEQQLALSNDFTQYAYLNGLELNDALESVRDKFWEWFLRSQYEISFDIIASNAHSLADTKYRNELPAVKDTLFRMSKPGTELSDYTPKYVCELLDSYFRTTAFSGFEAAHANQLDSLFNEKTRSIELFGYDLYYELNMPGQTIYSNAPLSQGTTLLWKVNAYRFMANDYILTATSRTLNVWAFALTFLLIVVAIGSFVWVGRNRKRKRESIILLI